MDRPTERELLIGFADKLEEEIRMPAARDPWTEIQTWVGLLLPAVLDAGLLWEYAGSSRDAVQTDEGESLGEFYLYDEQLGFARLESIDEVLKNWSPRLSDHLKNASSSQIRRYGAWAWAYQQR